MYKYGPTNMCIVYVQVHVSTYIICELFCAVLIVMVRVWLRLGLRNLIHPGVAFSHDDHYTRHPAKCRGQVYRREKMSKCNKYNILHTNNHNDVHIHM